MRQTRQTKRAIMRHSKPPPTARALAGTHQPSEVQVHGSRVPSSWEELEEVRLLSAVDVLTSAGKTGSIPSACSDRACVSGAELNNPGLGCSQMSLHATEVSWGVPSQVCSTSLGSYQIGCNVPHGVGNADQPGPPHAKSYISYTCTPAAAGR